MLPKPIRLNPKLIATVARRGKFVGNDLVHIKFIKKETGEPALAISISVKLDSRATMRNRINRKLRHSIALLSREGKIKPGDYLVLPKSLLLADIVEDELTKKLASLFSQV